MPESRPTTTTDFAIGVLLYLRYPIPEFLGPALREMGVTYVAAHHTNYRDMSPAAVLKRVRAYRDFCEANRLKFRILIAYSEFPDAVFREAAKSAYFEGVQMQEAPWGKIIRGDQRKNPHIRPFARLKPAMSLPEALAAVEAGVVAERKRYERLGSRVVTTNVFPVMFHALARGGMDVCPKFMKESFTPVAHANAWGAALQYGVDLWADGDLWFHGRRPGHGADELLASLLYAYWTGASRFLVEGAGGSALDSTAPSFKMARGSWVDLDGLISLDGTTWKLNRRGEVLREFTRDYFPGHPRPFTFRDVEPDIAVVRFPDAQCGMDWGRMRWRERAFGCAGSPATPPESHHWPRVWNLLTHGASGRDMTFFSRKGGPFFFFPLNGVVVFDHRVGCDRLRGVPLIVLTGAEVSDETRAAVARCVAEGATCVASPNLTPPDVLEDGRPGAAPIVVVRGKGRWVVTPDFREDPLQPLLRGLIGTKDRIRYRFRGGRTVTFRMVDGNPNGVVVEMAGGPGCASTGNVSP